MLPGDVGLDKDSGHALQVLIDSIVSESQLPPGSGMDLGHCDLEGFSDLETLELRIGCEGARGPSSDRGAAGGPSRRGEGGTMHHRALGFRPSLGRRL